MPNLIGLLPNSERIRCRRGASRDREGVYVSLSQSEARVSINAFCPSSNGLMYFFSEMPEDQTETIVILQAAAREE
jgi:hypothetical protein